MALLIGTGVCTYPRSATCDPSANDLVLCAEYTFEIRTFLFASLFSSERVALQSMVGVSDASF